MMIGLKVREPRSIHTLKSLAVMEIILLVTDIPTIFGTMMSWLSLELQVVCMSASTIDFLAIIMSFRSGVRSGWHESKMLVLGI